MLDALPVTLTLVAMTLVIEISLGLLIGARRQLGTADTSARVAGIVFSSHSRRPCSSWSSLSQDIFGVNLGILPVAGTSDGLASYILPAIVLALPAGDRHPHRPSGVITHLDASHVRTARGKGISDSAITRGGTSCATQRSRSWLSSASKSARSLAGASSLNGSSTCPGGEGDRPRHHPSRHALIVGFTMAIIAIYLLVDLLADIATLMLDRDQPRDMIADPQTWRGRPAPQLVSRRSVLLTIVAICAIAPRIIVALEPGRRRRPIVRCGADDGTYQDRLHRAAGTGSAQTSRAVTSSVGSTIPTCPRSPDHRPRSDRTDRWGRRCSGRHGTGRSRSGIDDSSAGWATWCSGVPLIVGLILLFSVLWLPVALTRRDHPGSASCLWPSAAHQSRRHPVDHDGVVHRGWRRAAGASELHIVVRDIIPKRFRPS